MRKLNAFLMVFAVLLFGGAVFAQSLANPADWPLLATNPLFFIFSVMTIVQFLKEHPLKKYIDKRWETIVLVFVLSELGGFLLWIPSWGIPHDFVPTLVTYALYAAIAAGFANFLKEVIGTPIGAIIKWILDRLVGTKLEQALMKVVDDAADQGVKPAQTSSTDASTTPADAGNLPR